MALSFDPIELLERGYATHEDPKAWIEGLYLDVVHAFGESLLSVIGYTYVNGVLGPINLCATSYDPALGVEQIFEMIQLGWAHSTPDERQKILETSRRPGLVSMYAGLGAIPCQRSVRGMEIGKNVEDSVTLMVPGNAGTAIFFASTSSKYRALTQSEEALWHRIAVHLGAGSRLIGRSSSTEATDVEAVLTPDGQLAHASSPLASDDQASLKRAAADIDRARTRNGRSDPFAALELWRGLLAGRWSLVEHFDSDGKRFMLARKNDPDVPGPDTLTRRQSQVVFFASCGCSTQEIGYALGLSDSTVSTHLSAALAKLGFDADIKIARAQLIQVATKMAMDAMDAATQSEAMPQPS